MPYVATERLYLDAAGKVVKEGDPAAVSLLVGKNGTVDDATAKRYGLKGGGDAAPEYDAVADHEAQHGSETDEQAKAKHSAMFNKAVKAPPADK